MEFLIVCFISIFVVCGWMKFRKYTPFCTDTLKPQMNRRVKTGHKIY